ncbi:uncharacterized protein srl isoform X2 [Venturia canescens]|uniref:uncharacterized protein srl isoform X2 n=1 Tax=Venturia canescens TaxID=32260 RepID=UPI001C9BCCC7|nr:uncharacterized protein LOC122411742 isoform X2 [Venturia canescens]
METGYLNFHDEEHFSDFSLSLDQHNLLDDSQSSLLAIDDDFDYVESTMDTSAILWGTEQELNGDMAVLPVSGVASIIPKIENMKEDFAKVLTDWQEHIGYLQASDMGEDIDMAELSMGIPEKLNTDLPEDIFHNENTEARVNSHTSPMKKRHRDFTNSRSPKSKTISESSLQDIAASRGKEKFDLASYITGDDDINEATSSSTGATDTIELFRPNLTCDNILGICEKKLKDVGAPPVEVAKTHEANSDIEDAVDVETVVEQIPVLEAGDVKSLLEQFEASEVSAIVRPSDCKSREKIHHCNSSSNGDVNLSNDSTKIRAIDQQKRIIPKPVETQDSKFHKNIRDSLPKEVIDRIKASARKKVISVIPALSSPKIGARSTRMQEAAATLSRTKLLKIVTNGSNSSSGRVDGSVQLDHDYCSSSSSSGNSSSASSTIGNSESLESGTGEMTSFSRKTRGVEEMFSNGGKAVGYYVPITKKKEENVRKGLTKKDCGSKKDSGLESGEVSDAGEEPHLSIVEKKDRSSEIVGGERTVEENDESFACSSSTSLGYNKVERITMKSSKFGEKPGMTEVAPVYGMKIRSALATSILQLRKGVLTKTKSFETVGSMPHNKFKQQMVSVLKKPPNIGLIASNPNESIVTTKNSSNDEVQNIIVRQERSNDSSNEPKPSNTNEEAKKLVPRRKLNLAEYRSRREQTRSDNSRTCSPIQPMTLIYIHHASTSTEPIQDDPDNPLWSEREIVSVLKPRADFEEEKNREKPSTREIAVQTGENTKNSNSREDNQLAKTTVATATTIATAGSNKSNNTSSERIESETRIIKTKEQKSRRYRRRRTSSSSSNRSRSRSPMSSRDRIRSRSRSRRCSTSSNPRRRRISHRRSSVSSSSSSWSSRSRSRSGSSTSRSRSRSLRSRSRSSRSRSRSRSSSRYSSCSRSSSRSNLGRNKWSGDVRHKGRRGRQHSRTSCDRYRRGSSGSSYDYRGWRRSTRSSCRRQYDVWYNKEKKRQMEERRVIYVGRLCENTTKADLRRRFEAFGPVLDISVHFREHGDNYGFVTFAYKNDAYEAVEHGNDDPSLPRYDLSFGGRRAFCKVKYADLDGMAGSSLNSPIAPPRSIIKSDEDNTFDLLLKEAKAKLRKRKV